MIAGDGKPVVQHGCARLQFGDCTDGSGETAASMGGKWNDGFSAEIIGFQEGSDHSRRFVPPDRIAHKYGIVIFCALYLGQGSAGQISDLLCRFFGISRVGKICDQDILSGGVIVGRSGICFRGGARRKRRAGASAGENASERIWTVR